MCECLKDIGLFLPGLAGILALFFWRRSAETTRITARSIAAVQILSRVRTVRDYICSIVDSPTFYEDPDFPFSETKLKSQELCSEKRPPQLIARKIAELKEELHNPIAQISGKISLDLLALTADLAPLGGSVGRAVFKSICNKGENFSADQLREAHTKVHIEFEKFEKILLPIIELRESPTQRILFFMKKKMRSFFQKKRK